jgi:hypothetical protein
LHAPLRQIWLVVHTLPHPPQLAGSVLVSTQPSSQFVVELGQLRAHMPLAHTMPPMQGMGVGVGHPVEEPAMLHASGLVSVFTQPEMPLHTWVPGRQTHAPLLHT